VSIPSTSGVAARVATTVRDDIRVLASYPIAHLDGAIKLDAMECPYELPDTVRDDIAAAVRAASLNRYPGPLPEALEQQVRDAFGVPAAAALLFGNGSDELIHLIVQACCRPGDVVLSPWPSFVYFDMAARFDHARFIGVPLDDDLQLDLPAMLRDIQRHRPKVIFLAMPNNPTGGLWPAAAVERILEAAPGLVVIDEAYQAYTDRTWMPRMPNIGNAVVLRTASKIGLAGLRFGYLAGPREWLAQIDKVRPPYNLGVLTRAALGAVLRHQSVLEQQAARVRADRAPLAQALAALPGVTVYPSEANFLLARFPRDPGGNAVHRALKTRKILVRNFSDAHPALLDCLRISIGTPDENAALIAALRDILPAGARRSA
jgi:histidinol-phosphate aminotransferase